MSNHQTWFVTYLTKLAMTEKLFKKKQKCDNREVQKILPKYISRLERTLKFMKIISFASNLCILTFFSVVVIPFCDGLLRENPRANAKNPSAQIQFKRRKGNGKRISNLHEKSLGVLWPRQKYWGKPKRFFFKTLLIWLVTSHPPSP